LFDNPGITTYSNNLSAVRRLAETGSSASGMIRLAIKDALPTAKIPAKR
jgi:hypothetical protein